ncbi:MULTISPECIES: transporter substrate-binding domain-containing protein [unclassified Neptuniibacter]|uniref:substrate-binding periplasmic protein n=1 Tax=unclassified Neptuniibacter TaxID=2630693 RepID=UPI000C4E0F27|nr:MULTISPECIES: transporter substrate-binding domain-containing protein [unclassified Neptuniibacter]MAY43342.1 amino acid ABC transporter [Oceanospirillaceae bacterium]|tara:strand:- start:5316 stop:6152 length:837 start_codon:yes stop_codon:yes gene_type:complete
MYRDVLVILILALLPEIVQACIITMGYRTTSRLPNITAAPHNQGLFVDLYTEAAQAIKCKLKIIRLPKKRILKKLQNGEIDFYPGFTFNLERHKYIHFMENGLPSLNVGLSRVELQEIHTYYDLKNMRLLLSLGAPRIDAEKYGLIIKQPPEVSFEGAIDYILDNRADFYEGEISAFAYYLKNHKRSKELKYHFNCCGGLKPLLLGFSRESIHFKPKPNPNYDDSIKVTPYNTPTLIDKNSIASQFSNALFKLKASGFTDKLFKSYYGIDVSELEQIE